MRIFSAVPVDKYLLSVYHSLKTFYIRLNIHSHNLKICFLSSPLMIIQTSSLLFNNICLFQFI